MRTLYLWSPYVIGQTIIFCPVISIFFPSFFFFFPRLISGAILSLLIFMAALRSRRGHYILSCGFFLSFFLVFLAKSQRLQIGCLPYFHIWCGLSANLKCMSGMCCAQLAANTGRQKSPFWHHRTILSRCIFAAEACIDNRKNRLNSNTSSICPHNMVNFGSTNGCDLLVSLTHPCKFLRLSRLFQRYCTAL